MIEEPVISPDQTHSDAVDEVRQMHAAAANPAQFAPIYEVYFPRIYAYCARRTATPQEAEDLTSAIFTRALRGLGTYRGGSVAAWLFRIAHNELVNHWRGSRPQISLEGSEIDLPADTATLAEIYAQTEAAEQVRHLVGRLPADQQSLLAMKLGGKLTSEQIGAAIGKSASAVRVEFHRIVKLLRVLYFEENPNHDGR